MNYKNVALYYPTIRISSKFWITKSLLYWDKISSIVPYSESENINHIQKYLSDSNLFIETRPDTLTSNDLFSSFEKDFKKSVEKLMIVNDFNEQSMMIHSDKVSMSLFEWLKSRNLATIKDDNWYNFNYDVALIYMNLLARYISRIQSGVVQSTDKLEYQKCSFVESSDANENIKYLRFKLRDVLPVPKNIDIIKLVKFKDKNSELYENFISYINDYSLKFRSAQTKQEIIHVVDSFERDIKKNKNELINNLNENRIDFGFDSIELVNELSSDFVEAKTNPILTPFKIAHSVISICKFTARNILKNERMLNNYPCAYLLMAKKSSLIN